MGNKQKKGKTGNSVNYLTRNKALNKLQLKLPDFRRLCILKGIHPREPSKKPQGHNKTYYHIKDVNFLQHEPLLEKFREMRAYERKVKKARAKRLDELAEKLIKRRPTYTLDHLIRERYPSFVDALRDLDDPLTMVHLFATLPAESGKGIPVGLVTAARRLCLEWQAYVTRTQSLRKVFVSVKGIYFQAEIVGQKVTWLVPHQLSQVLPQDVDYRVMVTFLEFYETLLEFANFKLYHMIGLKYPPVVDEDRADLEATIAALGGKGDAAGKALPAAGGKGAKKGKAGKKGKKGGALATLEEKIASLPAEGEEEEEEEEAAEGAGEGEDGREGEAGALVLKEDTAEQEGAPSAEAEDAALREQLFKGMIFWLGREVPREALMFVIRSFGGDVAFDGEGSKYKEKDKRITHAVVDRPTVPNMIPSREYVQPQWVFDATNFLVLPPTHGYGPGKELPPHLSPFVDNDSEGYVPEYAATMQELQEAARAQRLGLPRAARDRSAPERELDEEEAAAAEEAEYEAGIAKEMAGVPYSAAAEDSGDDEDDSEDEEEEDEDEEEEEEVKKGSKKKAPKKAEPAAAAKAGTKRKGKDAPDAEAMAMAKTMMPRKTRKLYEAMQMGLAKKREAVEELETKRDNIKKQKKDKAGGGGEEGGDAPTRRSTRAKK